MSDYKEKWESLWEIHKANFKELQKAEATADRLVAENARRLALLDDASHEMLNKGVCSNCFPITDSNGYWVHNPDDDCELAKELADA
jgi:hypothetical protein